MASYSLENTTIVAGGVIVEGFGEGDSFEIAHNSERWENVVNADGSVVNCRKLDRSGSITLRLRYDSPLNKHLHDLDVSEAYFEFSVEWPNGDIVQTDECLVQKLPDTQDGERVSNREWQLQANNLDVSFSDGL